MHPLTTLATLRPDHIPAKIPSVNLPGERSVPAVSKIQWNDCLLESSMVGDTPLKMCVEDNTQSKRVRIYLASFRHQDHIEILTARPCGIQEMICWKAGLDNMSCKIRGKVGCGGIFRPRRMAFFVAASIPAKVKDEKDDSSPLYARYDGSSSSRE
jgi:hypothetical protein